MKEQVLMFKQMLLVVLNIRFIVNLYGNQCWIFHLSQQQVTKQNFHPKIPLGSSILLGVRRVFKYTLLLVHITLIIAHIPKRGGKKGLHHWSCIRKEHGLGIESCTHALCWAWISVYFFLRIHGGIERVESVCLQGLTIGSFSQFLLFIMHRNRQRHRVQLMPDQVFSCYVCQFFNLGFLG